VVDPLVHHNVVNSGPLGWIVVQDLGDQVTSRFTDLYIIGEVVGVHSGRLDVASLEGRLSDNQCVDNDTD